MRNQNVLKMVIAALLMALGMVLPLLLGQTQVLGQSISPLHIPALLCGLTCGWGWGLALGFVLPILRSFIFGMPPLVAVAVPMAFEMAVYGAVTGLLYPMMCKKGMKNIIAMIVAMLIAMVAGRIVGGAAKAVVMGMSGKGYTFAMFVSAYFVGTSVGAVIHLIVVPAVAIALEKAGLSPLAKEIA